MHRGKMDEELIAAVFVREALWNPMHKVHKNANLLKKMWDEVAKEMDKDVTNRTSSLPVYDSDTMDSGDTENFGLQELPLPGPSTSSDVSATPVPQRKKIRGAKAKSDALIELEKKKIEILQQDFVRGANDDLLFFESLLPFMKDIPLVPKLRLRSKIQDFILNELEIVHNTGQQGQQNQIYSLQNASGINVLHSHNIEETSAEQLSEY